MSALDLVDTEALGAVESPAPAAPLNVRELWMAVLLDAIALHYGRDGHNGSDKPSTRAMARARATRWLERLDVEPGGFDWVCWVLRIDSGWARDRIGVETRMPLRGAA